MRANVPESAPEPNRTENIVRGVGSLSIQSISSAVLGFVLLGTLLRFLPSLAYGAYSSLQVSVAIAGAVSLFGLNAAIVKFLAPSSVKEDGSGWGAAKASLLLATGLSATVSLVLVVTAPFLSGYFMKSPSWSWVFYLGALWLFTNSLSTLFQGFLQGLRRYSLLAKALLSSRFVAVALAVAGLVVYQSLAIAIISWVVYNLLFSLAALRIVWEPIRSAKSKMHYKSVMKYAAPLGLAGLVTIIASNADIVVVGGYLDPVSLGVYNATIVITSVLSSFFVVPLVTALFAETSYSSATASEVSRGAALALRFGTLTVLPASLFTSAVAPQLFGLFSGGGAYVAGIPYLQLITLFYIFYALQTVAIYVLQGVGRTREVLVIGLITALGEIGLSVSLVPSLGLAGAALSRVAVMSAGCAVSLYFLRGYLKGAANHSFLSRASISSGAPAAIVFALTSMLSNRVVTLVPYTVLGVVLFFGCARVLGLLSPEDKSFLAHLLPAKLGWISRWL